MAHDPAHADDGKVHAHISPVWFYLVILGVLFFLTAVTYGLGQVQLGELNLFLAVAIATVKASLVVAYFMHLRWDSPFNALVFLGSVLFLAVFLLYTVNDTGHRGRINEEIAGDARARYNAAAGEWAPAFADQATGENQAGTLVYPQPAAHGEDH